MLTIGSDFEYALDRIAFARAVGIDPDEKQIELLNATGRTACCCTRQWGKSTVCAILAAHEAVYVPGSQIVLVSPSLQQSSELFRKIHGFWKSLPQAPSADQETLTRLTLENGSRIISLPGSEKTVRGYSAASLVVMDEAARVEDDLLAAVRPMMATVKNARFIAITTPAGRRGWFYQAWQSGKGWHRISVTAPECSRISPEFLGEERESLGETRFQQEYMCQFIDDGASAFNSELIAAAMRDCDFEPFFTRNAA
jgi:hypothetical protein